MNTEKIQETKVELQVEIETNVSTLMEADASLEKRIVILEEEVELLKKRPVAQAGTNIDYDLIPSKEDVLRLLERMQAVEKRNLE